MYGMPERDRKKGCISLLQLSDRLGRFMFEHVKISFSHRQPDGTGLSLLLPIIASRPYLF